MKSFSKALQIHSTGFPSNFWEWLLLQPDLRSNIGSRGFYELDRKETVLAYKEWIGHNFKNLVYNRQKLGIIPSLEADFFSRRPPALRSNQFFLVPNGGGNCIIFNNKIFEAPYLNLNGMYYRARELPVRMRSKFKNLVEALSIQWNEQSFIKALHFCGVFAKLVKQVCNANAYMAGPSGIIASKFPFWMKSKRGKLVKFIYEGMTDLDECLYPADTDIVMPIEAKIDDEHNDLSWHKLAFPSYRFIDNSATKFFRIGRSHIAAPYQDPKKKMKIMPVYCTFDPTTRESYLYVFQNIPILRRQSEIFDNASEKGILLNATAHFRPTFVYRVNMKWMGG